MYRGEHAAPNGAVSSFLFLSYKHFVPTGRGEGTTGDTRKNHRRHYEQHRASQ